MQLYARVAEQPAESRGCRSAQHQSNSIQLRRRGLLDGGQEVAELEAAMPAKSIADDGASHNALGVEEVGGAVADVVVRIPPQ